jgi:acyl-CoA thioester hydrolase
MSEQRGTPAEETGERSPERYELEIPVLGSDIDVNGHVNNVVYVRWVQDAATAHWNARTSDEEQASIAWVVVRHEIDYRLAALPGDTVVAVTWVGSASRHAYERRTELRRRRDGEVLARARTLWCPLDRSTSRPVRLPQGLRERFSTPGRLEPRLDG